MIRDLAVIAPVVMGSFCLLAVCAVYLRSQSFRLDGALLALCGVVLLGFPTGRSARTGATQDLARRLDALALLEGSIAEIAADQARLAEVVAAPGAAGRGPDRRSGAGCVTSRGAGRAVTPWHRPRRRSWRSRFWVACPARSWTPSWPGSAKSTPPTGPSHIVVEPVMPLTSADPAGQRKRLMDEAGRVIDHVFEELNQRVDIVTLVSEPVPGPRLRLARSEA